MEYRNIIDFDGELTGNAKKFLLGRQCKLQLLISFVLFVIFTPLIVVLALSWYKPILWFLLTFVFLFIVSILPPSKKAQSAFMPKRVYVDLDDEMIVQKSEENEKFHSFDAVKKVIDYGEWYYFKFYFTEKDQYFLCQKSLLTQGTLEKFEELFSEKIERKTADASLS